MYRMYLEILALIFSISGWVLVASTLPTDYWKLSTLDPTVVATNFQFSNLWKICVTDSIGVTDCKYFPSMLALDDYLQVCRALMITAICLGFFGCTFAMIGMKCTKIGGRDKTKARLACFAGVNFTLGGLCSLSSCSVYAHKIITEFHDPLFMEVKFDMGAGLFIGWGGSFLLILGGTILCFSIVGSSTKSHSEAKNIYKGAASHSHIYSYPRGRAQPKKQRPPPDYSNSSRMLHVDKNAYV